MNSIITDVYPLFELYQALRGQLLDGLHDADLAYTLPGDNVSLGTLCREIGEVQTSYITSFRAFKQDFSHRHEDMGVGDSVSQLKRWYYELDKELRATVGALSEDDVQQKRIDRGGGFLVSPRVQLEIYKEALLIFYGKCEIYLRALGRRRSGQWQHWIA